MSLGGAPAARGTPFLGGKKTTKKKNNPKKMVITTKKGVPRAAGAPPRLIAFPHQG